MERISYTVEYIGGNWGHLDVLGEAQAGEEKEGDREPRQNAAKMAALREHSAHGLRAIINPGGLRNPPSKLHDSRAE